MMIEGMGKERDWDGKGRRRGVGWNGCLVEMDILWAWAWAGERRDFYKSSKQTQLDSARLALSVFCCQKINYNWRFRVVLAEIIENNSWSCLVEMIVSSLSLSFSLCAGLVGCLLLPLFISLSFSFSLSRQISFITGMFYAYQHQAAAAAAAEAAGGSLSSWLAWCLSKQLIISSYQFGIWRDCSSLSVSSSSSSKFLFQTSATNR